MASVNYTYEDFQNALNQSGLSGQFSSADLKLAQSNPNAGMSILQSKIDYKNATTDEARALANANAESVRSSYGNYTGGGDGSQYNLNPLSPSSFTADTYTNQYQDQLNSALNSMLNYSDYSYNVSQPTYTNRYDSKINSVVDQMLNYGDFSYDVAEPTYTNQYEQTLKQLLDNQLNYKDFTYDKERPTYTSKYQDRIDEAVNNLTGEQKEFSYDPTSDQLYQNYRKQYTREGKRAMEDALGLSAANTGGLASSYATTAAAQAGNYYNAQMTDKIPELYQIAYNKYLNELQQKQTALNILQNAEQIDYSRYQDLNNIYDADKNFAYQMYQDAYNRLNNDISTVQGLEQSDYNKYLSSLNQYNTNRDFAYNAYNDAYNRLSNNASTLSDLEQADYNKYLAELSQYNTNRDFDYNTYLDAYNRLSNNVDTLNTLGNSDYEKYQDQRNFNYNQLLDEVNQQNTLREENTSKNQFNQEYQLALKENDYDTAYKVAAALASIGDTSYLYDLKKLLSGA